MIKTASQLKAAVEAAGHSPYFFTRETMRLFGDTMQNYGVRAVTVRAQFDSAGNYCPTGIERRAFELYRRRPVRHGNQNSAYFDAATFEHIHCIAGGAHG